MFKFRAEAVRCHPLTLPAVHAKRLLADVGQLCRYRYVVTVSIGNMPSKPSASLLVASQWVRTAAYVSAAVG